MKELLLPALVVLLALSNGCSSVRDQVPATQVSGTIGGQPFTFVGPKNVNITNFVAEATATTNGVTHVKVSIGSITAAMDPGVISMTTQGYAAMRAADSSLIDNSINTAVGAIGTLSGKAVSSVVKP